MNTFLKYIVKDALGQEVEAVKIKKIHTEIEVEEKRTDKLLLVQFQFDKPAPQALYLEDRLLLVAERIIDITERSKSTNLLLEGHTDIIGAEWRNEQLSIERAKAVEKKLVLVLEKLVEASGESYNDWVSMHNFSIQSSGFADSQPYEVTIWREGSQERLVIGDNHLPEGRSINRRVLVRIESVK